jgi:hypothetical protein
VEAFTGREQNGVPFQLPNGGYFHRARPVQAKKDSARFTGSHKNAFRHPKRADFQLIVVTKNLVDIFSQVVQVLQPFHTVQHWNFGLPEDRTTRQMNCGIVRIR